MNLFAEDDRSLARLAADGDERALTLLYTAYADPLFAFICHHMSSNRQETEEIWQETWLAALHSLAGFKGESRLFSWLCGIARHKMADYFRRRNRQPILLFADVEPQALSALLAHEPLPEEAALRKAVSIRLVEVLGELPAEYRLALTARYGDERSTGEVAEVLGKSYKATESLLSRARVAFRRLIEQESMEGEHDG
jgi:RNA polymerase sigma-70 factor, ECF subfamily